MAVALSSGRPFVTVKKFGRGRAVQWSSYDWMAVAVKGPMAGLDDLVLGSLVWSARKAVRNACLPNFAILRVDDCEGPFWWTRMQMKSASKPWLGPFFSTRRWRPIRRTRNLATNGTRRFPFMPTTPQNCYIGMAGIRRLFGSGDFQPVLHRHPLASNERHSHCQAVLPHKEIWVKCLWAIERMGGISGVKIYLDASRINRG